MRLFNALDELNRRDETNNTRLVAISNTVVSATNESMGRGVRRKTQNTFSMKLTTTNCDCPACQFQCKSASCLPSPLDVKKMIEAGLKDRLELTKCELTNTPVVKPKFDPKKGGCTFFDGKHCQIHNTTYKPLGAKLAHHSLKVPQAIKVRKYLISLWTSPTNTVPKQIINQFKP